MKKSTIEKLLRQVEEIKSCYGNMVEREHIQYYLNNNPGEKINPALYKIARVAHGQFDLNLITESALTSFDSEESNQDSEANKVELIKQPTETKIIENILAVGHVPDIDPHYVEWGNYKDVLNLVKSNKFFTLYITGESGTGKNIMLNQACAVSKRQIVRLNMTADTKEDHLLGTKTLKDGNIIWEDGPVTWCAKNGAILLIDEISASEPNAIMCLQNVLEGNAFFVKGLNEWIHPTKGFAVVCTDNTKGRGSDSGKYIGTNILNDAFLERFQMTMVQGYPNEKVEKQILENAAAKYGVSNDDFINKLAKFIQVIRKTYEDEGIEEHLTTRRATSIISVFSMIGDAKKAITLCTNRFDKPTSDAMLSMWDKLGDDLLSGS